MNAMSSIWLTVCNESDLVPGSGVCALVETGGKPQQIALFRATPDGPVYAIGNYDPLGDANVLSRGIIGSLGERLVVASPLYKQHFDLQTGECVEDPSVKVPAWKTRVHNGQVQLHL
ncbi:MAG TPA: nitrite reductase small subunit NirD [Candidatus Acidoferrum sp.]|nr:nitrite reductase small subunit NirD [Candidatus Acidoferrum sp.]